MKHFPMKLRALLLALVPIFFVSIDAFTTAAEVEINPNNDVFSAHKRVPTFRKEKNNINDGVVLTYLEINGWLVTTSGITILIDPLLEGSLDFGIPDLYKGNKRVIPSSGVCEILPPIDCILLTQGLDDHAHVRTLTKLQRLDPTVPIIAPPSAKGALRRSGFWKGENKRMFGPKQQSTPQVQFMKHLEKTVLSSRNRKIGNGSSIKVQATTGALVGPPWQRRENGYIIKGSSSSSSPNSMDGPSIYIEPHVEFNERELEKLGPVDIVISPISGQSLPAFELVHGPKDTMRLVQILQPRVLIPMQNGDIDTEGPVAKLVSEVGSKQEFQKRLDAACRPTKTTTKLVDVVPGQDIEISL